MKNKIQQPAWIPEDEAVKEAGYGCYRTLRRNIERGVIQITWTKLPGKTKRFYDKNDIDRLKIMYSVTSG